MLLLLKSGEVVECETVGLVYGEHSLNARMKTKKRGIFDQKFEGSMLLPTQSAVALFPTT